MVNWVGISLALRPFIGETFLQWMAWAWRASVSKSYSMTLYMCAIIISCLKVW